MPADPHAHLDTHRYAATTDAIRVVDPDSIRERNDWPLYERILRARVEERSDATLLLRAGLAAAKAGKTDDAAPLMRQGIWLDPWHELADEAQETLR